jgi:hypothetical protein
MSDDPTTRPIDPVGAAEVFSAAMRPLGFRLDFTAISLGEAIDGLLALPVFAPRRWGQPPTPEQERLEAGLAAYIGEALRRTYGGTWGAVYGQASVVFAGRHYVPGFWVRTRLTQGAGGGTFRRQLESFLGALQAQPREPPEPGSEPPA